MTLADKITISRIVLAPLFFILFLFPSGADGLLRQNLIVLAALWLLFIYIEISDWLDGKIARSRNEVSDFGKLLDPFSDTLVRLTYFLCFVHIRILPVVPFLLILYREFGILFLRVMMMKKGVAMGARKGGKLKAVFYMLTGLLCLGSVTLETLGFASYIPAVNTGAIILFIIAMIIAIISFIDYFVLYLKTGK